MGRRRAGANARSAAIGMLIHIALGLASDAREILAMNRGKPGGRYWLSETTAVAVAVARDVSKPGHRKIAGALAEASGGACTVTYSQVRRRATALDLDDVSWYVRRRGIRVVREGDARIVFRPDLHGTLGVTARRGESVTAVVVHGARGWSPARGARRQP